MANLQTTAGTPQIFQAIDNLTGLPLAGGKLYTYVSGTLTPQATYTDLTLTTPMPNPIILDNYGQAVFYLGPTPYRYDLYNAAGVREAHYPQDNITSSIPSSLTVTTSSSNSVTNKIQININGTTYYILASTSAS